MDTGRFLARMICLAAGGDPGKCDYDHCTCGGEGRELAKQLDAAGYIITPKLRVLAHGQSVEPEVK